MADKIYSADVLVIGGGFAGVCAAIQAARQGCEVILLEKERVLGGNCGPNCGVNPTGAHRYHPYASDTGIVAELYEQAAWYRVRTYTKGHDYSISNQWDTLFYQMLRKAGVTVLRCHYAREPIVKDGIITAVLAEDTAKYHSVRIKICCAVIESSGDGNIAALAGASHFQGREARSEYGERLAPGTADKITMGSSLVAVVRRTDKPQEFIPPSGTPAFHPGYGEYIEWWPDAAKTEDLIFFYPSETGGELDTIEDEDVIYDHAVAHIYSAWNYVKNIKYPEESKNWELLRIGSLLAKRESRRFFGDYVLRQQDLEEGRIFEDAVAYGGFSIDIHDPRAEASEYVKIRSYSIPPLYTIPYRCLYSREIKNLFFASRLLSASHIAHGSIRLMRTLGGVGEAVGVAAGLCRKYGCLPRDIYDKHLHELRQTLLYLDASIPGAINEDPRDLAPKAYITADSEETHGVLSTDGFLPLDRPRGLMLWDWEPRLDSISFYLRNTTAERKNLELTLSLHKTEKKYRDDIVTQEDEHNVQGFAYWPKKNSVEWGDNDNLSVFKRMMVSKAVVPDGFEGWICFPLGIETLSKDPYSDEERYVAELAPCSGIELGYSARYYDYVRRTERMDDISYITSPDSHAFSISPSPRFGEAANVTDGINRRYAGNPVHFWRPNNPLPQSLVMTWEDEFFLDEIRLTFDTFTRTHKEMPYEAGLPASPMCVKTYVLERLADGEWTELCRVENNYNRLRAHRFGGQKAMALRLTLVETWEEGARPGVYEVRVYQKNCLTLHKDTEFNEKNNIRSTYV